MLNNLIFANGTKIVWNHGDDGGGSTQYKDFLDIITNEDRIYQNCLEWCAGLSAIAFSLLDVNIVKNATLMDIYKPALETALLNASLNDMSDRVKIYNCGKISDIPIKQKFDLVVANPPHIPSAAGYNDENDSQQVIVRRLLVDEDWNIHREFYANISKYLEQKADIFISIVTDFDMHMKLAKENNLVFVKEVMAPHVTTNARIYHFKYEKEIH